MSGGCGVCGTELVVTRSGEACGVCPELLRETPLIRRCRDCHRRYGSIAWLEHLMVQAKCAPRRLFRSCQECRRDLHHSPTSVVALLAQIEDETVHRKLLSFGLPEDLWLHSRAQKTSPRPQVRGALPRFDGESLAHHLLRTRAFVYFHGRYPRLRTSLNLGQPQHRSPDLDVYLNGPPLDLHFITSEGQRVWVEVLEDADEGISELASLTNSAREFDRCYLVLPAHKANEERTRVLDDLVLATPGVELLAL